MWICNVASKAEIRVPKWLRYQRFCDTILPPQYLLFGQGKLATGSRDDFRARRSVVKGTWNNNSHEATPNLIWWVPNPPVANPGVAERAPWRSTKRGVAAVSSLLEMPTDSRHFPCTSNTLVRPQCSLARKAPQRSEHSNFKDPILHCKIGS